MHQCWGKHASRAQEESSPGLHTCAQLHAHMLLLLNIGRQHQLARTSGLRLNTQAHTHTHTDTRIHTIECAHSTRQPTGINTQQRTQPTCLPVSTSRSTTRPSAPHVTSEERRVLNAIASTRPAPQTHAPHSSPARRPCQYACRSTSQSAQLRAAVCTRCGLLRSSTSASATSLTPLRPPTCMVRVLPDVLPCGGVPQHHAAVAAPRGQQRAVTGDGDAAQIVRKPACMHMPTGSGAAHVTQSDLGWLVLRAVRGARRTRPCSLGVACTLHSCKPT